MLRLLQPTDPANAFVYATAVERPNMFHKLQQWYLFTVMYYFIDYSDGCLNTRSFVRSHTYIHMDNANYRV